MMPLVALELLAACIWVGSLACLAVVSAAARRVLDVPAQIRLFQLVGRRYGVLGSTSLVVAIGSGLALSGPPRTWSGSTSAAVALAGVLVVASAAAMTQARAMTRLRRAAEAARGDASLIAKMGRARRRATALRGVMALVTLAIVLLAAQSLVG